MGTVSEQRSNESFLHEILALGVGSNTISGAAVIGNPHDWIDSYAFVRHAEGYQFGHAVRIIQSGRDNSVGSDCTYSGKEMFRASTYENRMKYLKKIGEEDGIGLNQLSVIDFNSFVDIELCRKKASLSLTDDGNIRAVWKDEDGNHIGIQFFGSKKITYVIFKRRPDRSISREANVGNLEDLGYLVDDLELF